MCLLINQKRMSMANAKGCFCQQIELFQKLKVVDKMMERLLLNMSWMKPNSWDFQKTNSEFIFKSQLAGVSFTLASQGVAVTLSHLQCVSLSFLKPFCTNKHFKTVRNMPSSEINYFLALLFDVVFLWLMGESGRRKVHIEGNNNIYGKYCRKVMFFRSQPLPSHILESSMAFQLRTQQRSMGIMWQVFCVISNGNAAVNKKLMVEPLSCPKQVIEKR